MQECKSARVRNLIRVATPFDARWSFAVGGKSALKVTECMESTLSNVCYKMLLIRVLVAVNNVT